MSFEDDLNLASERVAKLYDLKNKINKEYDEARDDLLHVAKKKGIKRVATQDKNITITYGIRKTYSYPLLAPAINELGLFDKIVKTSINNDALEREIESGYFPSDLAKKALKKEEVNTVRVKAKEE